MSSRLLAVLLVGLAVALVSPVAAADPADARAGVRAALDRWTTAFNGRDATGACALFAPDLIATYSGVPDRDYPTMCRQLTTVLADQTRTSHYSYALEEVLPLGDLAVVRLVWTLRTKGPGDAPQQTVRERGVDIFRREPNGTWRIVRSMAYEEAAPK